MLKNKSVVTKNEFVCKLIWTNSSQFNYKLFKSYTDLQYVNLEYLENIS